MRELLETARLEAQAGPVDENQIERLIFRAAAPIVRGLVHRGAARPAAPAYVHVMLPAFLEAQAR